MLNLFRLNEPLRVIFVLILLLLIRLPMVWNGTLVSFPELNWLLIGEKLGHGAKMYAQLWDTTSPIASGLYWIFFELFGKSNTPYFIASIILVVQQAYSWNAILLSNDSFDSKNYIPALLYGVFMSLSIDFNTLPPILISMSFIILFLGAIIPSENDINEKSYFRAGIYLGLSIFTFLPSIILFLVALFNIVLFKAYSGKKTLYLLYGLFFIIICFLTYFFWNDSLIPLIQNYFLSIFYIEKFNYNTYFDLIKIGTIPLLILFIAIFKTFTSGRFINFQMNVQKTLLFYFLICSIIFFYSPILTLSLLIIYVPVFSFFVSHFLILIRKKVIAEILLLFFLSGILFLNFNSRWGYIKAVKSTSMFVNQEEIDFKIKNKKILVLNEKKSYYLNNKIATPYLNSHLLKNHFEKINEYATLIDIYNNFKSDLPEIIIDSNDKKMKKLFDKIPLLSSKYRKGENNFYYLKPNKYATH